MPYKKIIALLAICLLALTESPVSAWIEPTTVPPGNNIYAPLNTSSFGQSKIGGLILNIGKATHGLIVSYGLVGIGTDNPESKLDVRGETKTDSLGVRGNANVGGKVTSTGLEVNSTTNGVLFPRMTTDQRNAITSPPEGLLIFNTDEKEKRFNIFSNNSWQPVGSQNIITPEFAVGDGRPGDAYCKKKNITDSGIQEDWVNINNNEPCGEGKICKDGNCILGPFCGIDYYQSGKYCETVGTGYYSPDGDNNRYSCTNKPANSTYTSSGGGSNNCPWLCNTDYYKNGNSCSYVGIGYYSPNLNNNIYSCTNKPSNSFYTSAGNGTNNCSWSCNSGYVKDGGICRLPFHVSDIISSGTCTSYCNNRGATLLSIGTDSEATNGFYFYSCLRAYGNGYCPAVGSGSSKVPSNPATLNATCYTRSSWMPCGIPTVGEEWIRISMRCRCSK